MKNKSNSFDQLFKDKLEGYEVSFEPSHWAEMESKLASSPLQPTGSSSFGIGAKIAIGVAIVSAVSYFMLSNESSSDNKISSETVLEQTEVNKGKTNEPAAVIETSDNNSDELTTNNEAEAQHDSEAKTNETVNGETSKVNKAVEKSPSLEEKITSKSNRSTEGYKQAANTLIQAASSDIPEDESTRNFENPKLKTKFTVSSKKICLGEEIQFQTSKTIDGALYFWDFGDGGLTSTKQDPKRIFNKAGTFNVRLLVSKGEKNNATSEMEIEVISAPEVTIEWDKTEASLNDPYTEFKAISSFDANMEYAWKINSKSYKGVEVKHIFEKQGLYDVELTTSSASCTFKTSENINISRGAEPFIENAFTANGDGVNDVFPKLLESIDVPFTLQIFAKSGDLIYQTSDASQPWNGRINNSGDYVQEGTVRSNLITIDKYGKKHLHTRYIKVLIR